jgi:uncharacterized protein YyaL (SSP411 family)
MTEAFPCYFARGFVGQIDESTGVIHDVAVITEGRALGHGVQIDATTLEQVKAQAETYSGGLKVKMDHGGGAADIVGYLTDFRIAGNKLIANFHVLQNTPHRAYIFEIAEKIPDTFGMSIAFSGPTELANDKKTVLQRCSEIYSCDLVSEPAANADGLFSMKKLQEVEEPKGKIEIEFPMNEETKNAIAGMIESAMMGLGERLSKLESMLPKPEDKEVAMASRNDEIKLAAEAAGLAAVKEFAKSFGAPVTKAIASEAPAAPAPAAAQKFEELVAAKATELKSKSAAIAFCVQNHKNEYAAYRTRVQGGEIVKL